MLSKVRARTKNVGFMDSVGFIFSTVNLSSFINRTKWSMFHRVVLAQWYQGLSVGTKSLKITTYKELKS